VKNSPIFLMSRLDIPDPVFRYHAKVVGPARRVQPAEPIEIFLFI
jgi:hypothetical protein